MGLLPFGDCFGMVWVRTMLFRSVLKLGVANRSGWIQGRSKSCQPDLFVKQVNNLDTNLFTLLNE